MRTNNTVNHISPFAENVLIDTSNSKFGESVKNLQQMVQNIDDMAVNGVPFATPTVAGITRIATEQEVLDGTNTFAYVTPKTLQEKWIRPLATENNIGTVQLASNSNRLYDNRSDLFVTSTSGLWDILRSKAGASVGVRGTLAIASSVQATNGTNDTTAMTPLKVKQAIDTFAVTEVSGATETIAGTVRHVSNAAITADKHNGWTISPKNFLESNATESKNGTMKIATQAIANDLTDNTRAITPARIPKASATQQGIVLLSDSPVAGGGNVALSAAGALNSVVVRNNGFAHDIKIINSIDYRNSSNMNTTLWSQSWDVNRLKFHAGDNFTTSIFEIDKSGVIRSGGNIIAFQYSDARKKRNSRKVLNALERVSNIDVRTYIQKDMEDQGTQLGVIAQTVEKNNPELIAKDAEGFLKVNYSGLSALAIQAIKDLNKKIVKLENEIEKLRK